MVEHKFYKHLGPLTLVELLDGLDVEIPEGQFADIEIKNAAPVDQAGVFDICYFEGRKAKAKTVLADCKASVCLITSENTEHAGANNVVAIISKNPRADFARVLDRLYRPHDYEFANSKFDGVSIAPGAVIGVGASIGKGTKLGPNAVIGPGVTIGENCVIGANATIEFASLGNACTVQSGAVIGGNGFGVVMTTDGCVDIPHVGSVEIGNNVSIGSQTTIDRAMFGATIIGDGCKFDNLVQVAHNVKIGKNCMFAGHVGLSGSCNIGNNVVMGGRAGTADHINIGDGAALIGNSAAMRDVPSGEVYSGVPAIPIRDHMRHYTALRKLTAKKPK